MDYNNSQVKQASAMVESFISISKVLTKFTLQNASSLGLTILQMGVLNTINSSPKITLKEIADKLQLPKSTVSANVDDLVNLELIERKTNDKNRREIHLTSTAKGKELSGNSFQNALSYRAMIFALEKIPEEDVRVLIQIHNELLNHLQHFVPNSNY